MSQIIKNDKNLDKVPKFRKQLKWRKKTSFSNERPFKICGLKMQSKKK